MTVPLSEAVARRGAGGVESEEGEDRLIVRRCLRWV